MSRLFCTQLIMSELSMFLKPGKPSLSETSHETEEKKIPLPDEFKSMLSGFEFSSSAEYIESFSELPDEVFEKIQLRLGSKYLYISRKDTHDPEFVQDYTIPLQVARMEIDQKGDVVGIEIDDEVLAPETLAMLSVSPFFKRVCDTFSVSTENLSDTSVYREGLNRSANENVEAAAGITALKSNESIPWSDMDEPSREQSVDVMQGNINFVTRESSERYIQTIGAGPCIIVVGYDSHSETVGMVHADAFTDIVVATKLIIARSKEKVVVLGGQTGSTKQLIELKKYFDDNGIVVEWDILNEVKSIVVDKETGKIYNLKNIVPRKG